MGVVTLVTIDYGRIYGPLPRSSVVTDPVSHIGSLTNQSACQTITLQVNPDETKELNEPMEWLCYIHPAKTEDEQNMEAYIKEGQIYYRALRMIKAHEELLIWYSKDFAMLIGIPEIQRPVNGESVSYICPYCGDTFDYPFPLRAHVRFKCPQRRVWSNADKVIEIPVQKSSRHSPPLTSHAEAKGQHSLNHHDNYRKSLSERAAPKRRASDSRETECSSEKKSDADKHFTDLKPYSAETKEKSFDCNQNVSSKSLISDGGHSAFRKVDKVSSDSFSGTSHLDAVVPTSSRDSTFGMSLVQQTTMASPMASLADQNGPRNIFLESRLPMFPMMPPLHPAIVHMPRPGLFRGIPINTAISGTGSTVPVKRKLEEAETDLKNIENSNPSLMSPPKTSIMFDKPSPYSLMRINPAMDKMLHTAPQPAMHAPLSAVSLLQNCCAQCNATFRMTSDLVYHMRSHHKREFDPMKRKREEKLRCSICSESFRERHHLTRHMTSHL